MIRVFVIAEVPAILITLLEKSGEVQIDREFASPDVLLFYSLIWNRAALARIKYVIRETSKPAVVVCEKAEEPFTTDSLLRKDVSCVLQSSATGEQILAGLRAAAAGLKVLQDFQNTKRPFLEVSPLTPRELEILSLIADGEGNKSIAYLLEISEHTVKFHISSIFEKLRVSSRTEAVKAGITNGLISI